MSCLMGGNDEMMLSYSTHDEHDLYYHSAEIIGRALMGAVQISTRMGGWIVLQ